MKIGINLFFDEGKMIKSPLKIAVICMSSVFVVFAAEAPKVKAFANSTGAKSRFQAMPSGNGSPAWPQIRRAETRPWTWWWHGCAVNKADISANLKTLHDSGISGVNIVCLLDVRDDKAKKLPYLSKEWIEAVAHAVRQARRLLNKYRFRLYYCLFSRNCTAVSKCTVSLFNDNHQK